MTHLRQISETGHFLFLPIYSVLMFALSKTKCYNDAIFYKEVKTGLLELL